MTTVTITEFDDSGNVVSVTESEVHSFDSPEALEAFLDGDSLDPGVDAAIDESMAAYDAAHGITGADFARLFDAHVAAGRGDI